MTASEFSRLLNGRRIGKDKYVAKCPAHDDRKPSLSIAEGRQGVVIRCMSMGCETKQILDVLGLRWSDLFRGVRNVPSDQLKAIYKQRRIDALYAREQRKQDLQMMMAVIERPAHRRHQRVATKFDVLIYKLTDHGNPLGRDWQKEAGEFVRSQHLRWRAREFD